MQPARSFFFALAMLAACGCPRRPPPRPHLATLGRVLQRPRPLGAAFAPLTLAWSNSGVLAQFSGSRLALRLQDVNGGNGMLAQIDDRPAQRLLTRRGEGIYAVATGLPSGLHRLRLVKLTEPEIGEVSILGLDCGADGCLALPPPRLKKTLEFIGDSITAGYGNEGHGPDCTFSPSSQNVSLAYGPLTARALGAEASIFAWSGRGVWRNNDGRFTGTLPELYHRTLPGRADACSGCSEIEAAEAEAVVINLGTNDFAAKNKAVDDDAFVAAYRGLLVEVRRRQPRALILCVLGPMLTDLSSAGEMQLTHARKLIAATVAGAQADGDARVEFFEFPAQNGSLGFGCDYHPSLRTHAEMARRLSDYLRARLARL